MDYIFFADVCLKPSGTVCAGSDPAGFFIGFIVLGLVIFVIRLVITVIFRFFRNMNENRQFGKYVERNAKLRAEGKFECPRCRSVYQANEPTCPMCALYKPR